MFVNSSQTGVCRSLVVIYSPSGDVIFLCFDVMLAYKNEVVGATKSRDREEGKIRVA